MNILELHKHARPRGGGGVEEFKQTPLFEIIWFNCNQIRNHPINPAGWISSNPLFRTVRTGLRSNIDKRTFNSDIELGSAIFKMIKI